MVLDWWITFRFYDYCSDEGYWEINTYQGWLSVFLKAWSGLETCPIYEKRIYETIYIYMYTYAQIFTIFTYYILRYVHAGCYAPMYLHMEFSHTWMCHSCQLTPGPQDEADHAEAASARHLWQNRLDCSNLHSWGGWWCELDGASPLGHCDGDHPPKFNKIPSETVKIITIKWCEWTANMMRISANSCAL